jgi:tape measure domain-containing protein
MAMDLGTILVNVKADTAQLVSGFNKAESAVTKTTKQMSYAVKGLIGAYVGLNTLDIAKNFIKQADIMTSVTNKLKLVTKNTNELLFAQKELFRVAQLTSQGYEETVTLYSKLSDSMTAMGKSQSDIVRTVETVNKAIAISGATAEESASAVLQLGQAFGSGLLQGDELKSINENAQGLAKAIAEGMGVAVGELKQLGADGKITAEILANALAKVSKSVDNEYSKMVKTSAQAFENLANSTKMLLSDFDNAIGASQGLANKIFALSKSMDENKDTIIDYSLTTAAVFGKAVDQFALLAADIKNVAELLLDSIGIMAFGALKPVTEVLLTVTEALNSVNLSSDESVRKAKEFVDFANKGFTNFSQSARDNIKDIDIAYAKANVSVADRIALQKKLTEETKKTLELPAKITAKTSKEVTLPKAVKEKTDNSIKSTITDSLSDWQEYYIKLGDYNLAWEIRKAELAMQYGQEIPKELFAAYKAEFFDKIDDVDFINAEAQFEALEELYKKKEELFKEFDEFELTMKVDGLDDISKSMISIQGIFKDLGKEQEKYNDAIKAAAGDTAKQNQLASKHLDNQITGYANLAGALSSMFEEGSKEAATFQAAQTALALVEATRAILTAGTGDPYTAIPRMAAMAIMAKSLLGNIGIAFGGGSTTTTSDAFSSQTANTGTSTILGDATKASESMLNAMSTLEDFAQPQYSTLLSMDNYLESIANSIGGVSNLLIKNSGYALGSGYEGFDTGFSNNLSVDSGILGTVLNPINSLLSNIPIIGQINGLFGGIINSALGGLFGKTSVSQELTDAGINFADAYLRDAVIQLDGSAYQTISTTTKKKSWFSSSSSTSISTYFEDLNSEIERQFSLVLAGLYSTVFEAGNALDINANSLNNSLDNFIVSIGKISLKDKTADEIQDLLTNVFSSIGDNLAGATVPALTGFQAVGEGLFETLVRVVTGIEEASFYSDRLGTSIVKYTDIINKQGVVGFEALAQSIIAADEATYGFNNGVVQIIDNLNLTAEELYNTYLSFNDIRDVLEATNQSASNLSSAMITGAGSISALESGTSSYMENFLTDSERLNIQLSRLNDEFVIAGYTMPTTRQGFIDLIKSIDTSTDEGAKAYGRLIGLSDDYNDTISEIEDNLTSLISTFSTLSDSVATTILTLAGSTTDATDATAQIKSFWEKRKEIDSLLALNGNLTDSQQSKLSSLVGEVNSLATNIQSSQTGSNQLITDELISNLTTLKDNLDLTDQILSVNIVGIASNVDLISTIASTSSVPTLSNIVTSYENTDVLSTEIKDILSIIKDNLATYPKRTFDLLDNVINGNSRVKVQS